jgi:kynurenine formamidase
VQIIDLSCPVTPNDSEPMPIKVKTQPHSGGGKFGRKIIFFGKKKPAQKLKALWRYISGKERLTKNSFPDGEFINEETISLSVHTGTHLDSPAHFGTKCEGRKPKTIDEIPLEWCYGNGVLLNFNYKKPGAEISKEDIVNELKRINYEIKPFDIVLLRTDTDKKWGTPGYFLEAPGLSGEGLAYLVEKGVKIIGTDCYSLDRPILMMVNDYYRTKDNNLLWPAHFFGRRKEYFHIERLANLDKIPINHGFKVSCFPIKLIGLGAAWIRAVAIFE